MGHTYLGAVKYADDLIVLALIWTTLIAIYEHWYDRVGKDETHSVLKDMIDVREE